MDCYPGRTVVSVLLEENARESVKNLISSKIAVRDESRTAIFYLVNFYEGVVDRINHTFIV